ncbi:MAG: adenylate/guanylate cyclase domain-containing protein [Burkholderiales bacterium]
MSENANRTFICSVLFLDIVDYSRCAVTDQIRLKEQFNSALSEAIAGVAPDDRIILDTGDGAAVSFLGDPEDVMFVSLDMRDAIAAQAAVSGQALQVRLGINLGPVRLIKDLNGMPNIIGDGINVAQRVMSFADPGQILVSRSYHDVMARMSEDYVGVFEYAGAKTDKHVREHEVYAVSAAPSGPRRTNPGLPPEKGIRFVSLNPRGWAAALEVNAKLLVAAPLAFMLIVGTGIAARSHRNADGKAKPVLAEAPVQQAATPRSESPPEKPKQADAPAKPEHADVPVNPKHAAAPAKSQAAEAPAKMKPDAPAKAKEAEVSPVARAPAPGAVVRISALPWAEVYVDGKKQGYSPPLLFITVLPGKHEVELRNSSFPAHVETIDATPGKSVSIRYRFQR